MRRILDILVVTGIMAMMTISAANSADFLSGARGGGMGFSYFILADDPAGALYNPSALGYLKGWQTQFNYEKINSYDYQIVPEHPYFGHFGATYSYPKWGTFAINSLQSGSFSKLTNIPTQNHLALSFGRQLSPLWSAGASMKVLSEWGFGKRSAFDMDLSVTMRTRVGLAAALALENIMHAALSPEYLGIRDHLPRRSRLGLGYFMVNKQYQGALLLAGQFEESGISQKLTTSLFNFGTEWWFMQNSPFSFAIRGGFTGGQAPRNDVKTSYGSPTAGLSLNQKISGYDIRLDYSWQAYPFKTDDGSLPSNHYLALTFGWGGVPSYPAPAKGKQQDIKPAKIQEKPAPKKIETPQVTKPPQTAVSAQPKPQIAEASKPTTQPKKAESPQAQPAPKKAETTTTSPTPQTQPTPVSPAPQIANAPKTSQPPTKANASPIKPPPRSVESAIVSQAPKKAEVAQTAKLPEKVDSVKDKAVMEVAQAPQVIEPPKKEGPGGEKVTESKKANSEPLEITPFNVQMEVNEISSIDMKRVVFYIRPQQVIKSTSWKLYIFKAKMKDWTEVEASRWALRVIEGKGVPPINVIWDGVDSRGELASKGKYYFVMTAVDVKGNYYATDWFDFKLK